MGARQLVPRRPVVVCSVLERDAETTLSRLEAVPERCGLCEIRADHLTSEQVEGVLSRADRPCIVTLRSPEHGGAFAGSADERRRLRLATLAGGRCLVDVEQDGPDADLARGADANRVVLSHHGAPCQRDELHALLREMAATRAVLLKIVPRATDPRDVTAVRDLLGACEAGRLCAFAIGRAGVVSRLLAPAWGSWGSYGAATPDRRTADGQFTVEEMLDIYRVLEIGSQTRRFALLGRRVLRSPSPAMHAAAYRDLGLDAVYLPIEADRFDPELARSDCGLDLAGLAITMPFKEAAAERCNTLDAVAERCGAVNTIRVEGERWHGFNTDGPAALRLARDRLDPAGARVAIVGAGGTALSVGAVFRAAGARVALCGRTRQRTERAATRIDAVAGALDDLGHARWDVLVNATPLGGTGETVLPPERLGGRLVIDVVYGNQPTRLIEDARRQGLATIDGFELLVAQAELQFEHLLGVRPDPVRLAEAGRAWLAGRAPGG